jgi:molybdopterin-containing oxidoreductase family iron-sulfur binding subunit
MKHPASLGATDAFAQASVLTLCDPDRAKATTFLGEPRAYGDFLAEFRRALTVLGERQGVGLRILTETVTSPTLSHELQSTLARFPQAVWRQYEAAGRDNSREGARLSFGEYRDAIYRFDRAEVILSLDSDFLMFEPGSLRYAREFIAKRKLQGGVAAMSRLYVVEPTPSNTGAMADHRLPIKASEVEGFARAVAQRLGAQLAQAGTMRVGKIRDGFVDAVARDLQRHRGASMVVAGETQPPAVHALAQAMNQSLGNVGQTVNYITPVAAVPANQIESLRQLVAEMDAGQVELLVIISANPAYTAPADFHFKESLQKVALRVHQSLYYDETSALCHWHIPESHFLESWGDARAFDGTATIIQPLIAPLYESRSPYELLAAFGDQPEAPGYDVVRRYWQSQPSTGDFEQFWQTSLRDGVVADATIQAGAIAPQPGTGASNPQSQLSNPQSPIPNPQSAIRNPRSRSSSELIRRSTTGASRTTAGCRNCRSRSPN